jgi:hypothetical protein
MRQNHIIFTFNLYLALIAEFVLITNNYNRENRKPICLKSSVFGLLKTDRFRFRSRFPAGLYYFGLLKTV